VRVVGRGPEAFSTPREPLDCGNSGSTMRMLAGVLAGRDFESTLTGDASLQARPMKRIVEPLELMGAQVGTADGRPPLRILGSQQLKPIRYELPVASAQVKSCVLLAALNARGRSEVIETRGATRDHTEQMLRWFGVPLAIDDAARMIAIDGPVSFSARDVHIPGDMSSAAFLIAAAVLLPGSDLEIQGVGLNPTRAQYLAALTSFGFDLQVADRRESCNEPVGDLVVRGTSQAPGKSAERNRLDGPLIAQLIDELPMLAVLGTQLRGGLEIRDAGELRAKETDRIAATVTNLRAMGAVVEEFEDGLTVAGPTALQGARLDSFADHRIAMAFAVAALIANGESEIADAECVAVSFPEFFPLLETVTER
jgi:3-phosphoshikimate 1-carboxyvinyltransferase